MTNNDMNININLEEDCDICDGLLEEEQDEICGDADCVECGTPITVEEELTLEEKSRAKLIINMEELAELIKTLKNNEDTWFPQYAKQSVTYGNIVNSFYNPYTFDYEDDWNESVQYARDNGFIYESLEAEFRITALGMETKAILDKQGELHDHIGQYEDVRFLVEAPAGKAFKDIQEAINWVRISIEHSFGVTV